MVAGCLMSMNKVLLIVPLIISGAVNAESFFSNEHGKMIVQMEYSRSGSIGLNEFKEEYLLLEKIFNSENGMQVLISSYNYHMTDGVWSDRNRFVTAYGDKIVPLLMKVIGKDNECDLPSPWRCINERERDKAIVDVIWDIKDAVEHSAPKFEE